jgi:hypothetical protein
LDSLIPRKLGAEQLSQINGTVYVGQCGNPNVHTTVVSVVKGIQIPQEQ